MNGAGAPVLPPVLPPVGLYVHIPFCVSLCPYCDFVVVTGVATRGPRNRIASLVAALLRELDLRADDLDRLHGAARPPLASVYIGGGTPSLLEPHAVAAVLDRIRARFGVAPDAEITLEANPGPDERGEATAWRQAGVTRLSFGAQAMDRDALRRLGRRHTPEDVAGAVAEARAAGVGSVGIDLLYDVPGQAHDAWVASLDAALDLRPDHLSLYALALEDPDAEGLTGPAGDHLPVRAGARAWRRRAREAQDEDRAAAAYRDATERLAALGYRGYEISNWARPGHESRHNLAYWRRRPVEAVGPGAHAFDGRTRRWNAARLDVYVAALEGGTLPPGGSDAVDPAAVDAETAILALRLDTGLPASALDRPPLGPHAAWAFEHGLLRRTEDERVVLTTAGRLLADALFVRLV